MSKIYGTKMEIIKCIKGKKSLSHSLIALPLVFSNL